MHKLPILKPEPDYKRFRRVILGEEIPRRVPFVELFLDQEVLQEIVVHFLGRPWFPLDQDRDNRKKYWDNYIEAYYRLGYDFVWIDGRVRFPTKPRLAQDTATLSRGNRNWDEEGAGAISSWEEYESYPWPSQSEFDLWDIEYLSTHLYDGMGLFLFPCRGFLEVPLEIIMGYETFSYGLYDEPELIDEVCRRVGSTIMAFYRQVLGTPRLMGFFPGDDMGYKTSTLVSPDNLRRLILPWHKQAAALAHENGLLYMLHSCGQLESVMEDLIEDVKIDAKHSFEDAITPVGDFKRQYGNRIAVLGGVDIDKLCRLPEEELRGHVRGILEECTPGGRYALGSGNSVANYIPINNYLAMLDVGYNFT